MAFCKVCDGDPRGGVLVKDVTSPSGEVVYRHFCNEHPEVPVQKSSTDVSPVDEGAGYCPHCHHTGGYCGNCSGEMWR